MPHHSSEERSPKRQSDQNGIECLCLPESLLEEILLRLPLKSVVRFKCVCKSWHSRLSDPSFAQKYQSFKNFTPSWTLLCSIMHKHGQEDMLEQQNRLCSLSSDGFISPTISFMHLTSSCLNKILASSNGLLLCGNDEQGRYHLYNPSTQQTISLPQPVTWVDYQLVGLVSQMDECGLLVKSYKVVQVRLFNYVKPCFLDVFCSESGAWTTYNLYSPHNSRYLGLFQHRMCFLDKPISLKETLYLIDYTERIIMAYSPYADPCKLHIIHLPNRNDEVQLLGQVIFERRRMLGSCRGRLRYYYSLITADRGALHRVWELINDKDGEWCLMHSNLIEPNNDVWLSGSLVSDEYCPISFDPFDHDLMYFGKAECIYSYRMATRKLELLYQLDRPFIAGLCWSSVIPYKLQLLPALIPPPTWTTDKT